MNNVTRGCIMRCARCQRFQNLMLCVLYFVISKAVILTHLIVYCFCNYGFRPVFLKLGPLKTQDFREKQWDKNITILKEAKNYKLISKYLENFFRRLETLESSCANNRPFVCVCVFLQAGLPRDVNICFRGSSTEKKLRNAGVDCKLEL